MKPQLLTKEEQELVNLLGQCFNNFRNLPVYHASDAPEFANAIHVCQNIVFSRPAYICQEDIDDTLWKQRNEVL